jgi:hypothetical protein
MSTPSMNILPSKDSSILNKVRVIVDFPAPVLPTIPILLYGSIFNDTFFNAGGRFSLY